jgi:hypothetical protein
MLADTASDTCREIVRAMPEPYEKGEKWKVEERKVAEGNREERRRKQEKKRRKEGRCASLHKEAVKANL